MRLTWRKERVQWHGDHWHLKYDGKDVASCHQDSKKRWFWYAGGSGIPSHNSICEQPVPVYADAEEAKAACTVYVRKHLKERQKSD